MASWLRVTRACTVTSAWAPAGATRVMPCLVPVRGVGDSGSRDICGAEKRNLCLSEEGMWPLVSMHVTCCVRGFDSRGSVPLSPASASSVSPELA